MEILCKLMEVLKETPSYLVIVIIVYLLSMTLGDKLDKINQTLVEIHITNQLVVAGFIDESEDTLAFVEEQKEINKKLDALLAR